MSGNESEEPLGPDELPAERPAGGAAEDASDGVEDTSDFDDHISAFTGSGFNAAKWSHDDLPAPTEPVYDSLAEDAPSGQQDPDGGDPSGDLPDWDAEDWEPSESAAPHDSLMDSDDEAGLGALPAWDAIEGSEPDASAAEEESISQIQLVPPAPAIPEAAAPAASPAAAAALADGAGAIGALPDQPDGGGLGKRDRPSLRELGHRSGGRVTPHDVNAEKCVLGAVLLSPERLVEVSEIAKPADFYDKRNKLIFECMIQLDERGQIVDGVHLIATLRARGELGDIGGVSYLAEISSTVSTSAHVKHHAALVSETAKLRGLSEASNGIIERAFETAPDADEVQELIDESEAAIFAIASQGEARGATGVASILDEVFHSIEAQKERGEFTGIPSGFYELDDMLGGFNPGEMTVIAARPAMGKTAFVLNIMDHAATHVADSLGYAPSVLFFSLEMGRASIVQRMLVARAGVEAHRLRSGHLHDREYADLVEAAGVLKNARLFIDDTPGLSIMALRSRARRLKAEHGLDMIVIDYLQLLSA
ncbi:MAG: DnaB-like helicase C-terminal domain-containing protein, partial [Planctomycetota bacterium]